MPLANTEVPLLHLRPALSAELPDVRSILDEATSWLREQHIEQWQVPYPEQQIAADIARGEVWLGLSRKAVVGTLTLHEADPLWNDQPSQARYLHRLAVRRRHCGLGAWMIHETCAQLAAHGIQRLRLDCEASNVKLRSYYERLRFAHRGDVVQQVSSDMTYNASRYERLLG